MTAIVPARGNNGEDIGWVSSKLPTTTNPGQIQGAVDIVSRYRHATVLGSAIGVALLLGCESYPAAEDVATCAATRFGTEHGSFNVTQPPGSTEYTITYQKAGSLDRAVVVYTKRRGPVTTQVEISYGNHAEIAGAVAAIRYCAQPR